MARKKTDAEILAENNRILNAVEKWDPGDPRIAPFRTKNWLDKGWPALRRIDPDGTIVDPVVDEMKKMGLRRLLPIVLVLLTLR